VDRTVKRKQVEIHLDTHFLLRLIKNKMQANKKIDANLISMLNERNFRQQVAAAGNEMRHVLSLAT
jgi:hypothetical protein